MPGGHQTQIFASPPVTATRNDVYTQRLPHSASRGPAAPTRAGSVYYACYTKARLPHKSQPRPSGGHARSSSSIEGSVYCACHTKASRGPAAATRAAAPPEASVYCACHTKASRSSRRLCVLRLPLESLLRLALYGKGMR